MVPSARPALAVTGASFREDCCARNDVAVLANLTKLGRHGLSVLASQALESPHVVVWFVARLDARKKHRQMTRRTASLSDRSFRRVKTVWLRHDTRLLNFPHLNLRYIYGGDPSSCRFALRKAGVHWNAWETVAGDG